MRAQTSCARAERATSHSCSFCIICSSAAATASRTRPALPFQKGTGCDGHPLLLGIT
jgi:hypothetical protein